MRLFPSPLPSSNHRLKGIIDIRTGRSCNAPPLDGYPGDGRWGIQVTHVENTINVIYLACTIFGGI